MSRSGYSDDGDNWGLICWRGAVKSAIRGKRGQAFLHELLTALDSMGSKRLITGELETHGEFCTLGVIGEARGIDMDNIDQYDEHQVSKAFGIAEAMVKEIAFMNDEYVQYREESPEARWARMREWVIDQLPK